MVSIEEMRSTEYMANDPKQKAKVKMPMGVSML